MVKHCITSPIPISQLCRVLDFVENESMYRYSSALNIGVMKTSEIANTGEPGIVVIFKAEYQNGSPEPVIPDLSKMNDSHGPSIIGG